MATLTIDFPILQSIKASQMQHGLKYENYQRYTSYCSRRLHRLRRSLNVYQGVACTAKARHQRSRKLMDVSNAMVLEAGEKNHEYGERMLLVQLFLAERAWSHSMLLKQEAPEHPRKHFHMLRRLKKATELADSFEKLCHDEESPCSIRTKEEASAYGSYIRGLYKMERKIWVEAKENLTKALGIYLKLCISITNDEAIQHYRQRIEELRANLKYCSFNLSGQEVKKSNLKVRLPAVLTFHDVAYEHALEAQDQESQSISKAETPSRKDVSRKAEDGSIDDDDEEWAEALEQL